ncbi:hypothetical protein QVD17_39005 [Tagetes erecta]|uniref:Peptidase S49 domain-containing protein n=1 Tax=Tagetes erecta TaxID=13708 RepID=A0AAD8JMS1_TARER|nr:hypothetical protein QVD17_39005 [Tagetes erecta]
MWNVNNHGASVGISDGEDRIAVIRASGGIDRVEGSLFSPSSDIKAEQFIKKIIKVDKMEEIAQGRLWTGNDAASRGLVDAIGGF